MEELKANVKEKTNTCNKSCKESAKRESELFKMVEPAAIDEGKRTKKEACFKDISKQRQQEREEEHEARALIEEMQQNLEEARAKDSETERKLGRVLGDDIHSFEKEMERPPRTLRR